MNPSETPPATMRPERGFWHLTALQFQGALSDNIFRVAMMLIASSILTESSGQFTQYNALLTMLFPIAYLMISIWAGFLADRYSKRTITLATKLMEIVLMALAALSFVKLGNLSEATPRDLTWPTVVLFLMFIQSAIFSPSKYGMIPELVSENRLGWANGVIGLTTYVAIILGAALSTGLVALLKPNGLQWIPLVLILLSGFGLVAGWRIDRVPAANPTRPVLTNPFPELKRFFLIIARNRNLLLVCLGLAYFWSVGSILMAHVMVWSRDSLGYSSEMGQGLHFVLLALGIGIGSALAGRFSRDHIEIGLIPLGAIVMGLFAFPLTLATPDNRVSMAICLALVAMGGGMFSVPLNALLQKLSDHRDLGGILAIENYISNTGILLVSAAYFVLGEYEIDPNHIFLIIGSMTLIGTFIVVWQTPEALMRFVAFLLTHTIYRIRVQGVERIPKTGGVLMISNHVSYVDALLLGSICPRPVRFVAYAEFFKTPLLGYFLRATRSIPIASTQSPRDLMRSLKTASQALADGEVICLFAEGQMTRTGQLLPFQRGYELIVRDQPSPIVPIYLDGVWGSVFSFERRSFFWKRPRSIPYPVRVAIGEPMPADSPPFAVRQRILELGADAAIAGREEARPLHTGLVRNARRNWGRFAMVDATTPGLTWGRALTGATLLARRLSRQWGEDRNVGVLLPPSVGAALVNYAITLSGRTAINLNYTTGQETLEHCARQSGIRTVVTLEKFLEKVNLKPPAEPIWIDRAREGMGGGEKLAALLAARLLPTGMLMRFCGATRRPAADELATIIFSSGSTGTPKGVPLTHFNVAANIDSFRQAIQFFPDDRLIATLPFFHSFGYTVSLWGSALMPFGCIYHNNPLDAKAVGDLAEKEHGTLLVTTPTFLQMYSRRVAPGQFGGLKCVVAGAERLPDAVADAFQARFGIEPLQGYGATECSPVVSVNVSDHRSPGVRQVGNKRGSVGHPLPGVAVRVLDPDDGRQLGPNEAGLLEVRGPNVMEGYLEMPEKSAEVLRDGWYNTGDVATIDVDGFIFITGRLSRFSKIGGEMVPHGTVEDRLHALLETEERVLAVTGLPDEKKGEQLAVLHTLDEERLGSLLEKLPGSGLPNLFIPRREMFVRVEALPLLGTGKLDLKEIGRMARELLDPAAKTGES